MAKKIKGFFLVCFFLLPLFTLPAQEAGDIDDEQPSQASKAASWEDENENPEPEKKRFRLKNRMFEISLVNTSVNLSNDLFAAYDYIYNPFYILFHLKSIINDPVNLLKDGKVSVTVNDFLEGFKFDFNTSVRPLSINFNHKDQWGWGLDIAHLNVTGNVKMAENLLVLNRTDEEKFGVGGALFMEAVGIPVFFHVNDFKVKIKPAVYAPLLYTEPGITYSYREVTRNGNPGVRLDVEMDMKVYSPFDMTGMENGDFGKMTQGIQDSYWSILRENLGYDLGLGVEYPLYSWLDLGVDMTNIPFLFRGSKLSNYMRYSGGAYVDTSYLSIDDIIANGGITDDMLDDIYNFEFNDPEAIIGGKTIQLFRPFSMIFYANYRPFDTPYLTLIPSLGFSVNKLYVRAGSAEGGLCARFDLANMLVTTLGINYNDRSWKNSLDFIFNFRFLELDLGLSMQSPNFAKSWKGAGLGVNFGLKLGF